MPESKNAKKNPLIPLIAGGCAGFVETSVCHPLDTIKTRMQLRKNAIDARRQLQHSFVEPALRLKHSLQEPFLLHRTNPSEFAMSSDRGSAYPSTRVSEQTSTNKTSWSSSNWFRSRASPTSSFVEFTPHGTTVSIQPIKPTLGPYGTAKKIIKREGFWALYKGLTAVYAGIIPKMAVRFLAFEHYKEILGKYTSSYKAGNASTSTVFVAGLATGLTEAILVVTPAEVCKIRLQAQYHSMMDPSQMHLCKYRNVFQTAGLIVKEEGIGALYKGVLPCAMRQACNQSVNFTAYTLMKRQILQKQNASELQPWHSLVIGGISGGMGPLLYNPLDVVKTRLQKQVVSIGETPKYTGLWQACLLIAKEEGGLALWKGITPRLLRIMPGQAITFMTYEFVSKTIQNLNVL